MAQGTRSDLWMMAALALREPPLDLGTPCNMDDPPVPGTIRIPVAPAKEATDG